MELEGTVDKIIVKGRSRIHSHFILKEKPGLYWATEVSLPVRAGDYVKIITLHQDNKPLDEMSQGGVPGGYIRELKAYHKKGDEEPFLEFSI